MNIVKVVLIPWRRSLVGYYRPHGVKWDTTGDFTVLSNFIESREKNRRWRTGRAPGRSLKGCLQISHVLVGQPRPGEQNNSHIA